MFPNLLHSAYRSASLVRKRPTLWDLPRTLGTGLLQGPRGVHFLVSEVPPYSRLDSPVRVPRQTLQECLAHKKQPPPKDPSVGLNLGSYAGPRGVGLFLISGVPLYSPPHSLITVSPDPAILQGYLAHKKTHPSRPPPQAYA